MPRIELISKLQEGERLFGYVYGHSRFTDGTVVYTSRVAEVATDRKSFITRSGTHYEVILHDSE